MNVYKVFSVQILIFGNSRERKVLTGEWGGKEGKSRAALDFQIESGEDYLLSSASSIFFNSGLEGRGASAETMLPFLSKTMKRGIPLIL
mgnify:CR=1 FL=1